MLAQVMINFTKLTAGRVLLIYLMAGIVLEAFGFYEPAVKVAGAGATIPIIGFGYTLAKGAIEGAQKGLLDAITGGLVASAAGIAAVIVFGALNALIFSPRSKKN